MLMSKLKVFRTIKEELSVTKAELICNGNIISSTLQHPSRDHIGELAADTHHTMPPVLKLLHLHRIAVSYTGYVLVKRL